MGFLIFQGSGRILTGIPEGLWKVLEESWKNPERSGWILLRFLRWTERNYGRIFQFSRILKESWKNPEKSWWILSRFLTGTEWNSGRILKESRKNPKRILKESWNILMDPDGFCRDFWREQSGIPEEFWDFQRSGRILKESYKNPERILKESWKNPAGSCNNPDGWKWEVEMDKWEESSEGTMDGFRG